MDILVNQDQEVVPGLEGGFREYALFFADTHYDGKRYANLSEPLTDLEDCTERIRSAVRARSAAAAAPSTCRAEPLQVRLLFAGADENMSCSAVCRTAIRGRRYCGRTRAIRSCSDC